MTKKKLAVICPGIGYHKDKPLLYYAAKLAQQQGFEILHITYSDMPQKICGNAEMMQTAAALACKQTAEQLSAVQTDSYDKILLIGKSIGTIAAAKIAAQQQLPAKQIWYTPLEATFLTAPAPAGTCIAFLGTADPWSDVNRIKEEAEKQQIPLRLYPDCNHSLESPDPLYNIAVLQDVMQHTEMFLKQTAG